MKRKQQGLSLISAALLVGVIVLLGLAIIRLAPVYLENYTVVSVLESVERDSRGINNWLELRSVLDRKFQVNSITNVEAKDVQIDYDKNSYTLTADYIVKVPYFSNLSFCVEFHDQVVVKRGD